MALTRRVEAETLDHLAEDDPAAQRSRRDLRRVHRAMGTRSIVLRALREMTAGRVANPRVLDSRVSAPEPRALALDGAARATAAPLRMLELGAGDGSLMLGVARAGAASLPPVELRLLDRQNLIGAATLAGYADLGWRARATVADVLDWAADPAEAAPRQDVIVATLFLHHFEPAQLGALLGAIAARCDRFFACEPRRGWLALAGSHLIGALGTNAVTREDAVLSVHAGFRDDELSRLWPAPAADWRLRESPAGLFSHVFRAERVGAA